MKAIHYQKTRFLLSVDDLKQLPPDEGIEVAIIGRSNAGKSSVINRITQIKGLARVSKTPGRTQLINFFTIDDQRRLVDLPGVGFAKVPLALKKRWQHRLEGYLKTRQSLKGLILVMDSRHPLQPFDIQLLETCETHQLPVHILLNKCDQLSNQQLKLTLDKVEKKLSPFSNLISLQAYSALKGQGNEALTALLDEWYQ